MSKGLTNFNVSILTSETIVNNLFLVVLFTLSASGLLGCATMQTYVDDRRNIQDGPIGANNVAFEVFLVGNTGLGPLGSAEPVLRALKRELDGASEESAVVFLGDQLDGGMPDSTHVERRLANSRLESIAEAVDNYRGRVFVLPGDRDWDGPDAVRRQEAEIERLLQNEDVFIPGDSRAGPVVLELTDDIILIGLDTAWWLEDEHRPFGDAGDVRHDKGDYEISNPGDIIFAMESALREYDDENILVVGHHPLRSNGFYGSQFSVANHIRPLPVVGSAYSLYRQFVGERQDLSNSRYRSYRTALEDLFGPRDRLIYASAHEQSLQAFHLDESVRATQHYLISGSAAGGEPIVAGRGAGLASSSPGFMRLQYFDDGSVWLKTYSVEQTASNPELIYQTLLYNEDAALIEPGTPLVDESVIPSYADSTVVQAVNPNLGHGTWFSALYGSGYRSAWETPVEFPVLDLSTNGGLTPIRKGGGMQTQSLRLQGGNGHQYVLRLLKKVPARILIDPLHDSVVAQLFDDMVSATNPWSAIAVAQLAGYAGVYHTNPELVFIPDDPRLGVYREEFGNSLALFEERPSGDMSDVPSLGSSENVISSANVYRLVDGDNDHHVDQPFYLRSRLFDILIGDWDRHADQWRWASFEPFELDESLIGDSRTQGKIYRPIPRDRDFAFYRFDGLLPMLIRQVESKMQSFHGEYGSLSGLTFSGIPLDRRFTTELSLDEWLAVAEELRASLTDDVIDEAFRSWPRAIYDQYGVLTASILKQRRDGLIQMAEDVYRLYAGHVDVGGSDKHERFDVTIADDGTVEVVISKINRDGENRGEYFRRRFFPRETAEIRLYGLSGDDRFILRGQNDSSIRIRLIGGAGEDRFWNAANVTAWFYDTENGNDIQHAGRAILNLSDDPANNRYSPDLHRHSSETLLPIPGYSSTDGAIVGVQYLVRHPGFRKYPWASIYQANVALATGTLGLRGELTARYFNAFGNEWDAVVQFEGSTADHVNNFYGFGNETTSNVSPPNYYNVRLARLDALTSIVHRVEDTVEMHFGGGATFHRVSSDSTSFIGTPSAGLLADAFNSMVHAQGQILLRLNGTDQVTNPRQGFNWETNFSVNAGLTKSASSFADITSHVSVYVSPNISPQITLAGRAGVGHTYGSFPFYEAQTLGGSSTIRGLRRQRYSGNTVVFQNLEVRVQPIEAISRFIPLGVGVLGFVDNGRVWAEGESSNVWHQSYGGGIWFNALSEAIISASLANGDDGLQFHAGLGFFF